MMLVWHGKKRGIRDRGINKKKVGGPGKFSWLARISDLGKLTGIFAMQYDRKGHNSGHF
jgi:hypothetical protein